MVRACPPLVAILLCTMGWPADVQRHGRDAAERPVLLYYVVRTTRGGSAEERPVQVDVQRKKRSWSFYYQRCPRWQPKGLYAAASYDAGVEASRFSPNTGSFGKPEPIARIFGRGAARGRYTLTVRGNWRIIAWSPDGGSILHETRGGISVTTLSTGRRRTLVRAKDLSRGESGQGAWGLDWSRHGDRIAFGRATADRAAPGPWDPETADDQDLGTHYEVVLAPAGGGKLRTLGHGSRPRFSPDGRWLVAVDRYDDRFGTAIRRYDLKANPPTSRIMVDDARAACFHPVRNELAVVLANGDLVLTDIEGRVVSRVLTLEQIVGGYLERGSKLVMPPVVPRADIDW